MRNWSNSAGLLLVRHCSVITGQTVPGYYWSDIAGLLLVRLCWVITGQTLLGYYWSDIAGLLLVKLITLMCMQAILGSMEVIFLGSGTLSTCKQPSYFILATEFKCYSPTQCTLVG